MDRIDDTVKCFLMVRPNVKLRVSHAVVTGHIVLHGPPGREYGWKRYLCRQHMGTVEVQVDKRYCRAVGVNDWLIPVDAVVFMAVAKPEKIPVLTHVTRSDNAGVGGLQTNVSDEIGIWVGHKKGRSQLRVAGPCKATAEGQGQCPIGGELMFQQRARK